MNKTKVVKKDENGRVFCTKCDTVPQIKKYCGDNGSSYNGCAYVLECKCGDKGQKPLRSQMMAIFAWEDRGYKL